jgi:hypothetical protein
VVLKHQKSIFFFKNNCLHCSENHYRYIPWCMEWSVIRLYC